MKNRAHQLIASALFVTILLSFAVLHLTNAGMTATGSETVCYDGTVFETDSLFGRFYRGVYQNKSTLSAIRRTSYELFGAVNNDRILVGRNDFLFPVTDRETGYAFLEDYLGLTPFSEQEEQAILAALQARSAAYRERGTAYMLVILPNNQTLYSDKMPGFAGEQSQNTRLRHMMATFAAVGYDRCYDISETLISARPGESFPLCDNTENALNALGMYYTYRAVLNCFSANAYQTGNVVERDKLTFYLTDTEGRALAREAGLIGIVQNQTVTLSNNSYFGYRVLFNTGFAARTVRLPSDFSTLPPGSPSLLLQFTNSRDRLLCEPYFSNTFDYVTYQTDLTDNADVFEKAAPDVVIQFVRENELSLLLDN